MSGLAARFRARRSNGFEVEVDLTIPSGSTAALLGPNAAGKSTVVAALAGLLPVDQGRIELDGRVLDDPASRSFVPPDDRRIGVVFQDYLLFPHLDTLDNVAFGLRSHGLTRGRAEATAREWIAKLDLDEVARRQPADLSGGQAQRVALARALAIEPDLLLLDEPLSALDVTTRARLRHLLGEHLESFEGPRLLITHDPAEAFLLADEIHILEEGRITQKGSADDITLNPRTPYAADFVGANLLHGTAEEGVAVVGGHRLHLADDTAPGAILLTIHPNAISVHTSRPTGSPRNSWATTVERLERLGSRVRLRTGSPLAVTVEMTETARAELGLEPGSRIWVAVKATEITVTPDRF